MDLNNSNNSKRPKTSILDCPLSKGKQEISLNAFSLLFSEIIQYSQNKVANVNELQNKLSDLGFTVGSRLVDVLVLREKGFKRETKVLHILMFVKVNLWKALFGKEADKLEQANDDDGTYYIIEKDPIITSFISIPKDKGSLNLMSFAGGIVEAFLNMSNFPAKCTVAWYKGTTLIIKFDESVITRDKAIR